jgi:hypothetical protein
VDRGIDPNAFEAKVARALGDQFGKRPCRTPLSAYVVTAHT